MAENSKIMELLDRHISKQKQGILMVVCLVNKDELAILVDNINQLLEKFCDIVEGTCREFSSQEMFSCQVLRATDKATLYIVIPDDDKLLDQLTTTIHVKTQLYVDENLPEAYLRSWTGSIRFPQKGVLEAEKLISLLNYSNFLINNNTRLCYFNYDDNKVDLELLRNKNKDLNLLRTSLVNKTFKFFYQPIVDRETSNISYYECLLRVRGDDGKWLSVGSMICDAESKDLISVVDFAVTEMAIEELQKDPNISLSINISNIGVLNKQLLATIDALLKKYDVASRLIIEITETSFNHDFDTTKNFIDTLHRYGCRFALDDFGSGFTSFKQLLNLPIDIIKIDGSYIRDILKNDHSKFFVEALIKLAGELGIKTVAEFVENGEIAKFLIDIKIGAMQGNFFLPASDDRVS